MPPAKRSTSAAVRKTAAAAKKAEAAVEHVVEHVAEICGRCWPNGWPHLSHSASCEHGTYVRDADAAPDDNSDEKTPERAAADDEKTTQLPADGADGEKKAEEQQ